jgi:hypothetical protein
MKKKKEVLVKECPKTIKKTNFGEMFLKLEDDGSLYIGNDYCTDFSYVVDIKTAESMASEIIIMAKQYKDMYN